MGRQGEPVNDISICVLVRAFAAFHAVDANGEIQIYTPQIK